MSSRESMGILGRKGLTLLECGQIGNYIRKLNIKEILSNFQDDNKKIMLNIFGQVIVKNSYSHIP